MGGQGPGREMAEVNKRAEVFREVLNHGWTRIHTDEEGKELGTSGPCISHFAGLFSDSCSSAAIRGSNPPNRAVKNFPFFGLPLGKAVPSFRLPRSLTSSRDVQAQ